MAKDKELNRWSSLKKAVQYRPDHVEKYDVGAFRKKAQNEYLKRKFIPSLFSSTEEDETIQPSTSEHNPPKNKQVKQIENAEGENDFNINTDANNEETLKKEKKKKKNQSNVSVKIESEEENSHNHNESILESTTVKTKKGKKRRAEELEDTTVVDNKINSVPNAKHKKKKKDKQSNSDVGISDARLEAYGINPKKYKNKLKYGNKTN